jgi:hypothetical protein
MAYTIKVSVESLKAKAMNMNFHRRLIILFLLLTTFARFPGQDGEDIVNARANFNSQQPIDFWGGMSSLLYGNIPNGFVNWQSLLVLTQLILITIGLALLNPSTETKLRKYLLVFIYYFVYLFGAQTTRDGFLFSILVLSLGCLSKGLRNARQNFFLLGLLGTILGIAFRPWMALALFPLILYYSSRYGYKRASALLSIVALVATPILLEHTTAKSLNLQPSFPQQQVMIMDLASSYCWSNNDETAYTAISALNLFSSEKNLEKNVCNLYRSDTWLSLTKPDHASSSYLTHSNFKLIEPNNNATYSKLQSKWLRIIITDPVTYLQNKITFAAKLFIGSDTRGLRVSNANTPLQKLQGAYFIPYDFVITLHLLSIGVFCFFIIVYALSRRILLKRKNLEFSPEVLVCFSACALWLTLSSIAYIGSNGRYTYTITLISLLFLLKEEKV